MLKIIKIMLVSLQEILVNVLCAMGTQQHKGVDGDYTPERMLEETEIK